MLSNIKSSFFIRNFYFFIDERKILNIIHFNKKLQNLWNISLINYKFLSGKYKVYDNNGKGNGYGKEYDGFSDELIFEGKYLNRKRHGKGKEYDTNGKLIYEGDYLYGLRNGKGKEYDLYGLLYEGEYLYGKKHGFGKEYNRNGQLIYEGKFLNGKRLNNEIKNERPIRKTGDFSDIILFEGDPNGKGIDYYDKFKFEGEYSNGKRHGYGKKYMVDGDIERLIFEGEYIHGKLWKAKGYNRSGDLIYEIKNGNGYAKGFNSKGKIIFEGNYLKGEKNGKWKEYDNNGKLEFEGEYLYNHKRKGKEYISNGKLIYEGEYLFDKKWDGKGYEYEGNLCYELHNGNGTIKEYYDYPYLKFEGEYLNGKRNGKGKEYILIQCYCHPNIFEGEYLNGKRNGWGKYYDENNLVFECEYLNGKKNGKAIQYDEYRKFLYKAIYLDDKLVRKLDKYYDELIIEEGTGIAKEYKNEILIYKGEYYNGLRNGKGKEYDQEGNLIYEGEFLRGEREGEGKEYNEYGKLIFEGEFLKNKKWNGKEYHYEKTKLLYECKYLDGKILYTP